MDEISDASRRITEIIGVIDSIAFQTNILALNAAVEAAASRFAPPLIMALLDRFPIIVIAGGATTILGPEAMGPFGGAAWSLQVTTPTGISVGARMVRAMVSQTARNAAPAKKEQGSSRRWSAPSLRRKA